MARPISRLNLPTELQPKLDYVNNRVVTVCGYATNVKQAAGWNYSQRIERCNEKLIYRTSKEWPYFDFDLMINYTFLVKI